jgi:hypothetical protein
MHTIPLFNGHGIHGWRNPYEWGEAKVVDGEKGQTCRFRNLQIRELLEP